MADISTTPSLAITTSSTPLLSNDLRHIDIDHEPQNTEDTSCVAASSDSDLRRVADSLPRSTWFIAIVELCERSAYFGILVPMQNYLQNRRDDPLRPGGLGLGQAHATLISQGFMLWCFITPLLGAAIADQYLGRVKTILYSSFLYLLGLLILLISSTQTSYDVGLSVPGLVFALWTIGLGTGGIKTNVSSLIAEQYTGPKELIRVLSSGEKVVVDRELTIQRIFTTFFLFINLGSFSPLVTPVIEQRYGFSAAFALPVVVFIGGVTAMIATQNRYIETPPDRSILLNASRALWIAICHGGNLDRARPGRHVEDDNASDMPWEDTFIDDLAVTFRACKIFLFYPFYWAAYSQLLTNFISQAATMETHGIPNDIMANIDPLATLILLPLFDRIVFPFIRRLGFSVRHFDRILSGFLVCGVSMLSAAHLQSKIYGAPPCYNHPRADTCNGGRDPNQVSVFLQMPVYVLIAVSEVLASVAGVEYAYTKAPKSMKSLVMAIYLSTVSVGTLLAMTVSPLTWDPQLVWMYLTLALGCFVASIGVWLSPL